MRIDGAALLVLFGLAAAAPALAAPRLVLPVSSNDQVGVVISGKSRDVRGVSAMLGMWSDDGALELAGFQQGNRLDSATARVAEIVSGKPMESRGVRLTGWLYRSRAANAAGWTVSVDARQQRVSDLGAALTGAWRTASDSRLTLGGKLRF